MKNKLSPKQIIGSLAYPVFTAVICSAFIAFQLAIGWWMAILIPAAAIIVCSVVPVIITFIYKADTSRFLLVRTGILFGTALLFAFMMYVGIMRWNGWKITWYLTIQILGLVLLGMYFIHKKDGRKKILVSRIVATAAAAAFTAVGLFIDTSRPHMGAAWCILGFSIICTYIYYCRKSDSRTEMNILCLSDPMIFFAAAAIKIIYFTPFD